MQNKNPSPPRSAKLLLKIFLHRQDFSALAGDFEESYLKIRQQDGKRCADRWYYRHVMVSLPALFRRNLEQSLFMLHNYFKVSVRNILRHKAYSFINIAGLAVGMAACILLLLWVQDELAYDGFHQHADHLYRVINRSENVDYLITPGALGPAVKSELPEVLNAMRCSPEQRRLIKYKQRSFYEDGMRLVDPTIFELFSFPWVKGDQKTALDAPESVVLTESLAKKYFGSEDPLGKTIVIGRGMECRVTGLMADVPSNSHLQFTMLRSFATLPVRFQQWENSQWYTYVQLRESAHIEKAAQKITASAHRHQPGADNQYLLQPLKRTRLYSTRLQYDSALRGDIKYVAIFSILAFLILLTACINYMNLATARSSSRAREIGLRKVVGAVRSDIIKQFLGESCVFSVLAMVLAIILVIVFLPWFNTVAGKDLISRSLLNAGFIPVLLGILLVTSFLAGSYPALYLSSQQSIQILKSSLRSGGRAVIFRKILVVVQFAVTMFLIIGSLVIYNQVKFMQNKDLGYAKEQIVYMPMYGQLREKYTAIKAELLQNPDIADVSSCFVPIGIGSGAYGIWDGKTTADEVHMYIGSVDYNYLDFFGMEMAAGRFFSRDFSTDATAAFVVNQAAARAMKMKNPIGRNFAIAGGQVSGRIIGVVKDFHFRSLHNAVEPFIFIVRPEEYWQLLVKIKAGRTAPALVFLEGKWKEFVPDFPPDYAFLDETLNLRYGEERRVGTLFQAFTGLAIFIAMLGLFGLTSFMTDQRTKEIGIRKVLGASQTGLVFLFVREFTGLVFLACLLAWPAAYYAMLSWLRNFAYAARLNLGFFLLSLALALLFTVLTVAFQSFKAAAADPSLSLRYE